MVATQTFFIFIPIWENDPIWLIFFKWVETTKKLSLWRFFCHRLEKNTQSSNWDDFHRWSWKYRIFESIIQIRQFKNCSLIMIQWFSSIEFVLKTSIEFGTIIEIKINTFHQWNMYFSQWFSVDLFSGVTENYPVHEWIIQRTKESKHILAGK